MEGESRTNSEKELALFVRCLPIRAHLALHYFNQFIYNFVENVETEIGHVLCCLPQLQKVSEQKYRLQLSCKGQID